VPIEPRWGWCAARHVRQVAATSGGTVADWIDNELRESAALVEWLRTEARDRQFIATLAGAVGACLQSGGRVLTCGNGGSMCDAMHCAQELSGRFRRDRPALAALAISDPSHMTCVANDYGFDQIFARGVEAWGRPGDVLLLFSTSGRSANIVAAAAAAKARSMTVIGLLGRDGGDARSLCDHVVVVPAQDSARIQEVHIKIVHLLIEGVERLLFSDIP
jgi:D-sedoheptulose 7-phosphate isomerase